VKAPTPVNLLRIVALSNSYEKSFGRISRAIGCARHESTLVFKMIDFGTRGLVKSGLSQGF
jgi:hypothetical protein